MTTNYASGMTNVPVGHALYGRQGLDVPYRARWQEFFTDFNGYAAADWVVTVTQAGSGSATQAAGDADGGTLVLTNDNADNDLVFLQSVAAPFTFSAGKRLYFEARLKLNEVIQADAIWGLQVRDVTALGVADGVWFQTDDGDALVDFHSALSSAQTDSTGVYTMVADTYGVYGFFYNGVDAIEAWAGAAPNAMGHVASQGITTLPTTTLTVSFGVQQGEATNLKIMTVDYLLVAKER